MYNFVSDHCLSPYFINNLSDHAYIIDLISYTAPKDAHSLTKTLEGGGEDG